MDERKNSDAEEAQPLGGSYFFLCRVWGEDLVFVFVKPHFGLDLDGPNGKRETQVRIQDLDIGTRGNHAWNEGLPHHTCQTRVPPGTSHPKCYPNPPRDSRKPKH